METSVALELIHHSMTIYHAPYTACTHRTYPVFSLTVLLNRRERFYKTIILLTNFLFICKRKYTIKEHINNRGNRTQAIDVELRH